MATSTKSGRLNSYRVLFSGADGSVVATPRYNSGIAEDMCLLEWNPFMETALSTCLALNDAILLLKVSTSLHLPCVNQGDMPDWGDLAVCLWSGVGSAAGTHLSA